MRFKILAIVAGVLAVFVLGGLSTKAASVLFPYQGGTGSSTLSGILLGNGAAGVRTLTVGSNLTLTGTTLAATGGTAFPTSTNPLMATYFVATTTTGTSTFYGSMWIGSNQKNSLVTIGSTTAPYGYLANDMMNIIGSENDYRALNVYNLSLGNCATADVTVANNNVTNFSNFGDFGHTSSSFNGNGCVNNPFTAFDPDSTYIFDPNGDINFALGSTTNATAVFKWFAGGYASSSLKMLLSNGGNLGLSTTTPQARLSVHANPTDVVAAPMMFLIGSSTQTATSTLFSISNNGATVIQGFDSSGGNPILTVQSTVNAQQLIQNLNGEKLIFTAQDNKDRIVFCSYASCNNDGTLFFDSKGDGTNVMTLLGTNAFVGVGGTTTPGTSLGIGNTGANTINLSSTATSTFGSGLSLSTGCFAIRGVCVAGSGAPFAWTPTTSYGVAANSTSTPLLLTGGIFASTTLQVASSTGPQIVLDDGSRGNRVLFRAFAGNLYFGTSTNSTLSTSTLASLTLLNGGQLSTTEQVVATSTAMNIDWNTSPNQVVVQMGGPAMTIGFNNASTTGMTKRVIVCNPKSTAGALTWAVTGVSQTLLWAGNVIPAQTTTANKCDAYSFLITTGTSTMDIFGAATLTF